MFLIFFVYICPIDGLGCEESFLKFLQLLKTVSYEKKLVPKDRKVVRNRE